MCCLRIDGVSIFFLFFNIFIIKEIKSSHIELSLWKSFVFFFFLLTCFNIWTRICWRCINIYIPLFPLWWLHWKRRLFNRIASHCVFLVYSDALNRPYWALVYFGILKTVLTAVWNFKLIWHEFGHIGEVIDHWVLLRITILFVKGKVHPRTGQKGLQKCHIYIQETINIQKIGKIHT